MNESHGYSSFPQVLTYDDSFVYVLILYHFENVTCLSVNTPFWNKLRNFYDVVDQKLALVELNNKVVNRVVFLRQKHCLKLNQIYSISVQWSLSSLTCSNRKSQKRNIWYILHSVLWRPCVRLSEPDEPWCNLLIISRLQCFFLRFPYDITNLKI